MTDKAFAKAKHDGMNQYFGEWESRVAFLDALAAKSHADEALLLACCYVDVFGNNLYGGAGHRNFVRVLVQHGGNPALGLIHPSQVHNWLVSSDAVWCKDLHSKLDGHLKKLTGQLFTDAEFALAVQPPLMAEEVEKIRPHLWRGTLASVIYTNVRCEAVHSFPPVRVSFGLTTFGGKPLEPLDYTSIAPAVKSILAYVKATSLESGKYYGHDFAHLFANVGGVA